MHDVDKSVDVKLFYRDNTKKRISFIGLVVIDFWGIIKLRKIVL